MQIVNLAIIGTILLALAVVLYWYQKTQSAIKKEKKISEIEEKIESLKGEIYNSIFEYETLLGSKRYISKAEYPSWYEKWNHLDPIVTEFLELTPTPDSESEIETLKTIFIKGERQKSNNITTTLYKTN